MIQWSLSGHQHVCFLVTHKTTSKGRLKKNERCFQVNQYLAYRPHSQFKPTWVFYRFCLCPSNDMLGINENSMLVMGPHGKDKKSCRDKANTGISNVNRGCSPFTVNHTSEHCMESSLGPTVQHIPQGVYHTGEFNAMHAVAISGVSSFKCWHRVALTHLALDKMTAISQMMFNFNFTEDCSSGTNWQWPSIGWDNGLAPKSRQAIIWTNANPIHWRIHAALEGDEFKSLICT